MYKLLDHKLCSLFTLHRLLLHPKNARKVGAFSWGRRAERKFLILTFYLLTRREGSEGHDAETPEAF